MGKFCHGQQGLDQFGPFAYTMHLRHGGKVCQFEREVNFELISFPMFDSVTMMVMVF